MVTFPSLAEYEQFEKAIKEIGFRKFTRDEKSSSARGYALIRPKSRSYQQPGEIQFIYQSPNQGNDYRVIVSTTKRSGGWVIKDSPWVIIIDSKGIRYSRVPFRRSANFLDNLLEGARVARWRVFYRPLHCGKYMSVAHRHGVLKSCFWKCAVDKAHNQGWDDLRKPLPEEILADLKERRKLRKKARQKIRQSGKKPNAAFKSRMNHSWQKEMFPDAINF